MDRRVPVPALVLALAVALTAALSLRAAHAEPSPVLVAYSFDDGDVATGPDTLAVFQNAKGSVRLAREFRYSGYHSVEIRDVPGDGDFPELQGFFPERHSGWLIVHFTFLTTDPHQELNMALAGPAGFRLDRDGIAFWLTVRDGQLMHTSDSIPKRLLTLRPFTWYGVDVDYNIDRGRYRLRVFEEGNEAPTLALDNQANAASAPGSAVNLFSFIGDKGEDTSAATYYVDDVVIGLDKDVVLPPFVAPGRRKLFVDQWSDYRELAARRHTCLPASDLGDFALTAKDLQRLRTTGQAEALRAALAGKSSTGDEPKLAAIADFTAGCAALARGDATLALAKLGRAADAVPDAALYRLEQGLALLELGRLEEVEVVLSNVTAELRSDPRWAAVAALLAVRRGDHATAAATLRVSIDPQSAHGELLAEQSFFLQMWERNWLGARQFAAAAAAHPGLHPAIVSRWRERQADAAFQARDLALAQQLYESAFAGAEAPQRLTLKLADVHFLRGDIQGERSLREKIYGRLSEERRDPELGTLPDPDAAYLDRIYSLVIAATNAKQTLLAELAETGDLGPALVRYQTTVETAQKGLRSQPPPEGLAPFRDDIATALALHVEFFVKAVASRRTGEPYAAIWRSAEGRQASAHLVAAFHKLVARYPGLEPAARDLFYHRLCALDLY